MPFIDTFEKIGMERGRADAFTKGIEKLLVLRFRAAAAGLMSEIRQIHDHEQLERILDAAATVASPGELRKLWASGSGG